MSHDAKSKRAAPISYRPPQAREAEFRARVTASGLSTNAFITECIFGRTRHRHAELRVLGRLLHQTAAISDQLDELARGASDDPILVPSTLQEDLGEIRAALLTLMGRCP